MPDIKVSTGEYYGSGEVQEFRMNGEPSIVYVAPDGALEAYDEDGDALDVLGEKYSAHPMAGNDPWTDEEKRNA